MSREFIAAQHTQYILKRLHYYVYLLEYVYDVFSDDYRKHIVANNTRPAKRETKTKQNNAKK